MEELVRIIGVDIFTDSMVIAKGTGNEHHAVRELIKRYEADIKDFGTLLILNEKSTGGRPRELFLLNEEQATFVMTLLRNSNIVVAFKKELVRQFYSMRQYIMEHQSSQWQQTRLEAKNIRKLETAEIKKLVQYAEAQGSQNADRYYSNLSRLANKTIGISSKEREHATINQLNTLILVENIINHMIQEGIRQELSYKKIYETCKQRLEQFQEIAFLTFQSTKEKGGILK